MRVLLGLRPAHPQARPGKRFRFAAAQSPLGESLFRRHGLPTDDYDSNLAIVDGVTFTKLDSFIAAMSALGWPWRATKALPILPRPLRDWLYDNGVKSQILAKSRDG
ncbi:DCC1-like thiol-disulfide oxidoreductase family protein [Mesorhizobium sp.]|uniref:thiol-disulfide oxidoreductase DCC family protein n=1 Tax=Mesorhizobium sp. TaxID=1871066 RepID=UPI0034366B43